MTQDLKHLRAICEAATPGPWTAFPKPKYSEWHVSVPIEGSGFRRGLFDDGCPTDRPQADCEFIAAFNPQAVRELLDRLELVEHALADMTNVADISKGYIEAVVCNATNPKRRESYSAAVRRLEMAIEDANKILEQAK
jgi:hypothetical protein